MTTYTWNVIGTGNWDDKSNWYNDTAGMSDDGYPRAGDTAFVDTTEVTVSGDTVAILHAASTDIDGDITVTNYIDGGVFTNGTVTAGTAEGITFEGVSLTANTIDYAANLDAGTVTANVLVDPVVDGATVTAQSIERDPSGQYASNSGVTVESGSLTAGTMTLVGPSAAIDLADSFSMFGGTATITGTATATGAGVEIYSHGGTLRFSDGLTLSDGALLDVYYEGKTTVETLTAGETGDGTIDVEGAGSTLTVVKTLSLGNGALTLANGGTLIVDGDFDMGENAGSTSTETVGDQGARQTIRGEWQIGVAGTATPTITKGVMAEALGGITLGVQATGNGTLTVSQANTVLSVTGDIVIGEAGTGALNVQDGAIVDAAASDVTVGEQNTATGTVTISGAGSQFQVGSLIVGSASGTVDGASKAAVQISSGGYLEIAGELTLGLLSGSSGTLSVTDAGSQVSVGGDATLGADGSGTLTMTGGAVSVAGAMTLGEDKGSSGKMTLSDATVSITGDLNIGEAGSGSAIVQLASVLKSKAIELGGALGASGSLTISGAETSVTTGETTIGAGGAGSLKVNSGGLLTTNGDAIIGSVALGAIVSASLDTGGEWLVNGALVVGDSGAGKLSIAGKETLVTVDGDMTIGVAAGGTVTLGSTSAASSAQLTWGDLLTVGEGGKGTLTINAGDSVSALAGGKGQLVIGADVGSSGAVSLAGTGASLSGTALFVGGTATKQGGAGSLSISAGASATFANATIWATGKVTDAGALSISGALSGAGSVKISGAGQFKLGGSDSTVGIDFVSGGSNERLDLSAAHLPSVEIQGFGANDTIDVSGLSHSDAIGVSYNGDVATVRFLQAGKTVGSLRFAKEAGQGAFHFDAADGALTFAPTLQAYETALSALEPGGQAAPYALPLDVFATSSGGVPYPTGAALDPFIGDLMLAGHYGGAFLSAHAFP